MGELINTARVKYDFLNENIEIKTNEVKTYTENKLNIDENFYIPRFLSRIYDVNSIELLVLCIKQKKYKSGSIITINYAIICNYKNEFLNNQSYIKSFSKNLKVRDSVNLKNSQLSLVNYKLVTGRFIKIYLAFDI